jgi:hypothetical protein
MIQENLKDEDNGFGSTEQVQTRYRKGLRTTVGNMLRSWLETTIFAWKIRIYICYY